MTAGDLLFVLACAAAAVVGFFFSYAVVIWTVPTVEIVAGVAGVVALVVVVLELDEQRRSRRARRRRSRRPGFLPFAGDSRATDGDR